MVGAHFLAIGWRSFAAPLLPAAVVRDDHHRIADLTLPEANDHRVLATSIQPEPTIILIFDLTALSALRREA